MHSGCPELVANRCPVAHSLPTHLPASLIESCVNSRNRPQSMQARFDGIGASICTVIREFSQKPQRSQIFVYVTKLFVYLRVFYVLTDIPKIHQKLHKTPYSARIH